MAIRKVNFIKGEYYHVYNRGNSKQKIFYEKQDYLRFTSLLYLSNTKERFNLYNLNRSTNLNIYKIKRNNILVNIGAYCLMPNHFHIFITQTENGSISKFMQKITTAYSMYFNKKYNRTGALFEGKFKSTYVSKDNQAKYLFSYIHLNPVKLIQKDWKERGILNKKEVFDFLQDYKFSSYLDFTGHDRVEKNILSIESFPNYFTTKKEFQKEILEWLNFKDSLH
jgi:putative transposase